MGDIPLTEFEKTLFITIHNVVEKLVSAIILYESKLAYPTSFYITVIAEEEMSKLFLLPIINECGGLMDILKDRKSAFYNHRVKHKIFCSYVFFERDWSNIEEKKQGSLYVGVNKDGKFDSCHITPQECREEIKHSIWLFQYHMKHIVREKTFTLEFIKMCQILNNLLSECIKDKMSDIVEDLKKDIDDTSNNLSTSTKFEYEYLKSLFKNPYELIRLVQRVLGKDRYKDFLKNTHRLSFDEMIDILYKELKI